MILAQFVKDLSYTVTIKAPSGDGSGSTDPQPGVYPVKIGKTLKVTATPGPHSYLKAWILDGEEITPTNPLIIGA